MLHTRISGAMSSYRNPFQSAARKSYGTSRLVDVIITEDTSNLQWQYMSVSILNIHIINDVSLICIQFHKTFVSFIKIIFSLKENRGPDPCLVAYLAQVVYFTNLHPK